MEKTILMLVDYKEEFYHSAKHLFKDGSLKTEKIKKYFSEYKYTVLIKNFSDINLKNENYKDMYVIYQSSEDKNLFYKDYIEDILLGLKVQQAILIPNFYYFRAHHNKVFMEILRVLNTNECVKSINAKLYGVVEDALINKETDNFPKVLKASAGCGGGNVILVNNRKDFKRGIKKVSKSKSFFYDVRNYIKHLICKSYRKRSRHRRKFVIQDYIPHLKSDYKVLVYGDKYYVLYRMVRKNDFRASGSGIFKFLGTEIPHGLLDFSEKIYHSFNTPFISLDIGFDGKNYILFEFQFLHFGNFTLEKSSWYFQKKDQNWEKIEKSSIAEQEFVESIIRYILKLENKRMKGRNDESDFCV